MSPTSIARRSGPPETALSPSTPAQPKGDTISALLARPDIKSQISLALPRHMTPDRLLRIALTEVRRNPRLAECSQASLLASVFMCAQLGLEPGGALGHAWLVPFKNEVQFQLGYKGMIELARRSGQIESISAQCVFEGDQFECELGLCSTLRHVPDWTNPNRASGDRLTHTYAVARLKDGGVQFEVMSRAEIDAVRKRSRSGGAGPWTTDYNAMAMKTVVRRLFKWLPVSIEVSRAVTYDEAAEAGIKQETDLDPYLEQPTLTQTVSVVEVSTPEPDQATEPEVVEEVARLTDEQTDRLAKAASMRLSQPGQDKFCAELGLASLLDLPAERFDEAMKILGDPAKVRAFNDQEAA